MLRGAQCPSTAYETRISSVPAFRSGLSIPESGGPDVHTRAKIQPLQRPRANRPTSKLLRRTLLEEENIKVAATVEATVRLIRERASQAGVRLEFDIPDNLPRLRADKKMVKRILLNLLSNAVKFTPAGGSIRLTARADEGGGFDLSVSDTGIGIGEDDLPKVMEPFGQVES